MARLVRTGPSPDNVVLDFNEKPPAAWLFALWGRRWVRVIVIGVALLIAGGTAWYQLVVKPTLTATELRVWVAGGDRRLTIKVDDEADTVVVSGGQAGLSEIIVAGDSMFVLANEVGVNEGARWVDVPLSDVDSRFSVLASPRVVSALSINYVECEPLGEDAALIAGLLLDGVDATASGVSICGGGVGAAADDGQDLLVDKNSIPPTEVAGAPDASVVDLAEVSDPVSVVAVLDGLLGP